MDKNGGTTSCPFSRPPQKWVLLVFGPFLFFFFLFLLHLGRGCSKKPNFYRFLHTLVKHLVTSCSNNQVKPKLPPKKVHIFFSENLFFDQKQRSKTLILHHPLKIVHQKLSKKPYFYRLKKGGQVIDLRVAKLLTLKWPKCGQLIDPTAHIYIYI